MFPTFVSKILNPLSLSVKLDHYQNFFFDLSTMITKVWPQLFIKTKKWELQQICRHQYNGSLRFPNFWPLKIIRKFMIASIHIYQSNKKRIILNTPRNYKDP